MNVQQPELFSTGGWKREEPETGLSVLSTGKPDRHFNGRSRFYSKGFSWDIPVAFSKASNENTLLTRVGSRKLVPIWPSGQAGRDGETGPPENVETDDDKGSRNSE